MSDDDKLGRIIDLLEAKNKRKPKPQRPPGPPWHQLCILGDTEHPHPLPIVANAFIALENDTKLKDKFAFDEMLRRPMITESEFRAISDDDITELQKYLQHEGLKRLGRETTRDALFNYCLKHRYHPLRDYLDALKWDNTARIAAFMPGASPPLPS